MPKGTPKEKVQVVVIAHTGSQLDILLMKTNEARGSFWQNITGSVEEGESLAKAAERELLEESGIKLSQSIIDLQFKFQFTDQNENFVTEHVFLVILNNKSAQIALDPHEHSACQWIDCSKVSETNYKFLSSYQAFIHAINYLNTRQDLSQIIRRW
ncbi:MAG: NUDIX domain-containing protein [Oligoflexia bacterium]|nr:NUDIX domain-containing protein [Oligoflexia bacterium]MBF0364391.1 NUDIX domain-containing protein [Oligoflexia bacterium]